jgi:drug/metabolite transporter (DMT)-like permease
MRAAIRQKGAFMQSRLTRHPALPRAALFAAALIWGSSFFMMKHVVAVFPTHYLLAIRFTAAAVLLAASFRKRLYRPGRRTLLAGLAVGGTMFVAYAFQTLGLTGTTPGKNAFLTAVYCVIVPFLYWLIDRRRPDRFNIAAAFLCLLGIGLVSLDGDLSMGRGDALTLVCGFFFACNIVAVARFSREIDLIVLTIFQFAVAAACCWICALAFERFPPQIPGSVLGELVYLTLCVSTLAYLCQNFGLKHEEPTAAAIILSLECVFGVLFSLIFYGERLTLRLATGFAVIFLAVIISETKLQFLSGFFARSGKTAP